MTLDRVPTLWYGRTMHASHSSINSYLRCGKAFELEKIKNYPTTPAWWLIGGSAVHAVTEAYDKGEQWAELHYMAEDCLYEEIQKAVLVEPDESKWLAGGYGRNAQRFEHWNQKVKDYAHQWADRGFEWDWVELDVSMVLPSGLEVKGYIDRAKRISDHEFVIEDLKSGSTRPDSDQQLGIYSALFKEWARRNINMDIPGHTGWKGFNIHVSAWNYMFKDNEEYEMDVSHWTLDAVDKMAQQWYSGVSDKVFLPVRGKNCERCSVADACYLQSGDTPVTREYDSLNPFHKE